MLRLFISTEYTFLFVNWCHCIISFHEIVESKECKVGGEEWNGGTLTVKGVKVKLLKFCAVVFLQGF